MPSSDFRRYLTVSALTAVLAVTAIVILNYWVDPFFTHQWDSPLLQRIGPAQQKIVPWGKTYAAYRYQPQIVYLGSSRAEIGLPADSSLFAGKRLLNLAISGASLGDAIAMLRHTSHLHSPEMVIWGLDYGWQFRQKSGNSDLQENLLARNSWYPWQRLLVNSQRAMSLATASESLRILTGTGLQQCLPILATYGQKSADCLKFIMADEGGTAAAFTKITEKGDPQAAPKDPAAALALLEQVTDDFCRQGTAFRFFVHPVHALAELSYWEEVADELDQWKKEVTQLFARQRQAGCDIRFFDFSGFNAITSEAIPQQTGRADMQHYWEHSHYRSEVGEIMLRRMLGPQALNGLTNFGRELTSASIDAHLAEYHHHRDAYCRNHPKETANMRLCRAAQR